MGFSKHTQLAEVIKVEQERKAGGIYVVNAHISSVRVLALNVQAGNDIRSVLFSFHAGQVFGKVQFQHVFMPVETIDIDSARLAVIYRVGRKQLADVGDQKVCAAPGIAGDGSNLLGNAIIFKEVLTEAQLPAGSR